jgi:streptogramin lyase
MINPTTHAIIEFSAGLTQSTTLQQGLVAGPDGNLWFTESTPSAIGMINPTTHAISEFSVGLNPGSRPGASIVVGPDGALWFMDGGTTQAIGRIDPTTHAITEFSVGLNPGAALGRVAVGPDGNLWFGDKGVTKAIYVMNPTTHAITSFTSGLNAGSLPGGIWSGPDGNVWFTDQGAIRAIGRIGVGAPAASIAAPTISGPAQQGFEQVCHAGVWADWAGSQPSAAAFGFDGYQWFRDGVAIPGRITQAYTPSAGDEGHELSCAQTVTYTLLTVTVTASSVPVFVQNLTDLHRCGPGPVRSRWCSR